ncbi:MAG TPA: hypothetical protein VFK81_07875 [Terriglobales bacterium]|nr:hypothetical protein [Terriglobales bacterium]
MRKTENNSGGLGVSAVVSIVELCTACIGGLKADAGAGKANEFSSIGRTSAG